MAYAVVDSRDRPRMQVAGGALSRTQSSHHEVLSERELHATKRDEEGRRETKRDEEEKRWHESN